ncbi:MAG: hypothetical protein J5771_07470 [Bacteroidales bacterium]|nr:hypothetical protein [Bacteroidales bacterium]
MISVYTLTSSLHDAAAVDAITAEFLEAIGLEMALKGADFSSYGEGEPDLIYVRTGGTEGVFKALLPELPKDRPFFLLTSGKSNSLAASMEILSYLNQCGLRGEILHGSPKYLRERIEVLAKAAKARKELNGQRLGVVGAPSDWLISSGVDYATVRKNLGIELVDIPMERLLAKVKEEPGQVGQEWKTYLPGAEKIYEALKAIIAEERLNGLTIRCFDLLTAVKNTGCLALAKLNSEGFTATCEGDIPAMLSMAVARAISGCSGFQCNASEMNPETREILFAHCTLPLSMARKYNFDTHYESGIGVGIHGEIPEGEVTIFKLAGDQSRFFAETGEIIANSYKPNLCRTQITVRLREGSTAIRDYFLREPIGNHHIVIPGNHQSVLGELFGSTF